MNDVPRVLQAVAADEKLLELYGIEYVSAENGLCVVRATVTEAIINATGYAHGGLAFAMADVACAYAVSSTDAEAMTVNANMTYLKGATAGMALESRAELIRKGARIASLRADVRHGDEIIAHGTFTFMLVVD